MNYTDKLQLKKPSGSDFYDIADFNYNADAIDAALIDNLTTNDSNKFLSAKQGKVLNDTKETLINKVTSISSSSTDAQYPSALCVYNAIAQKASKPQVGTISLSATWAGSTSPYSQVVSISGATVTANSKVDLQPNSTLISQMVDDECNGLYLSNNNGTVTCYAVGSTLTAAIASVQVTVTEMA